MLICQIFCLHLSVLICPYEAQPSDPCAPDPIILVNIHTLGQFTVSTMLPLNPPGAVFTQVADTNRLDPWNMWWRIEKYKNSTNFQDIKMGFTEFLGVNQHILANGIHFVDIIKFIWFYEDCCVLIHWNLFPTAQLKISQHWFNLVHIMAS